MTDAKDIVGSDTIEMRAFEMFAREVKVRAKYGKDSEQ
jgi:hypothetical protein